MRKGFRKGFRAGMRSGTDPQQTTGQLLFSDLIRGPANSFVWLYGWTLPSSPYVTVNGVPCPEVAGTYTEGWVPANGNNPRLDRVCVQVPQGGTISISGASGSVAFTQTGGTIYERTDNSGAIDLRTYSDGDVVYLREGTYNTTALFNSIIRGDQAGVACCGYPGETATIDVSGANNVGYDANTIAGDVAIVVSNLFFRGAGDSTNRLGARFNRANQRGNIRFIGNTGTGMFSSGGSTYLAFDHCWDIKVYGNVTWDNGSSTLTGNHEYYHGGRVYATDPAGIIDISYNYSTGYWDRMVIELYGHGSQQESANPIEIRHNYIDRQGRGMGSHYGIQAGGSDVQAGLCNGYTWINDCLMHSNTVINSTDHSFRLRDEGGDYVLTDNVSQSTSDYDYACYGTLVETGNSWQ